MISTITRGADFRDLLRYVLGVRHDPALIATNSAGHDIATLTWELTSGERERQLRGRPGVERPVVHVSLSLAHEDRRLSQAELSLLAERFLERNGYGGCYYVVVEHRDREHQHVHLVVSRVRSDGSLAREQLGDFHRAMDACRQLEREFGLRRLESTHERGRAQASRDEFRHAARTGQASERARLQALVSEAMRDRPDLAGFVTHLESQGVTVRLLRADDGPVLGISYRLERFAFKGSALGPSYTWRGIQREGVSFDARRDSGLVERLGVSAASRERPSTQERLSGVRKLVDHVLAQHPTLDRFAARLESAGVSVRLNVASTGHVSGVSYVMDGHRIKGSQLGRPYSWHALRHRGLQYDPSVDLDAARALADRASTTAGSHLGERTEQTRRMPAFIQAADRLASAATTIGRQAQFVEELAEDPGGALGRAASRMAWSVVVRGASELAGEVMRKTADNLVQQSDRATREDARRPDPSVRNRADGKETTYRPAELSPDDRDRAASWAERADDLQQTKDAEPGRSVQQHPSSAAGHVPPRLPDDRREARLDTELSVAAPRSAREETTPDRGLSAVMPTGPAPESRWTPARDGAGDRARRFEDAPERAVTALRGDEHDSVTIRHGDTRETPTVAAPVAFSTVRSSSSDAGRPEAHASRNQCERTRSWDQDGSRPRLAGPAPSGPTARTDDPLERLKAALEDLKTQPERSAAERPLMPRLQEHPSRVDRDYQMPAETREAIDRAWEIAAELKRQGQAGPDQTVMDAIRPEPPSHGQVQGLSPEMAAAVDRAWEVAEEFKRHVAGAATSAEKATGPTTSGADLAASALRQVPDLARIKDLSESPEKAAIAVAKTGLSIAVPNLAPIAGAAAKAIEKEVDRSEVPVHLP